MTFTNVMDGNTLHIDMLEKKAYLLRVNPENGVKIVIAEWRILPNSELTWRQDDAESYGIELISGEELYN